MFRAVTVSVVHADPQQAGREVAEELCDELGAAPDLVILFAAARYAKGALLDGIYSRLPETTQLIGCSSYAQINSEEGLVDSVTALGMRLGRLSAHTVMVEDAVTDCRAAGQALGQKLLAAEPSLVIVLPDGLHVNSTRLLLGMQDILGRSCPIVGGEASDAGDFTQTYQFIGRRVISDGAVAVALRGPLQLKTAARSGWVPVGKTHVVTQVERGNIILTIDDRPALELYKQYLGPRALEMPAISPDFPIGLVSDTATGQKVPDGEILLLRAILGMDEARQAIILGGECPEGAEIRMTRAGKQDVIGGADQAGRQALSALPEPSLALIFDCMARKVVLGARYKEELHATFHALGPSVPKIGFYCFGELSPVEGVTMHHHETFTMALLKVLDT